MQSLYQFKLHGRPAQMLFCPGCTGRAAIMHNGREWQQVQLQNSEEEWRPNGIRPGEAVDLAGSVQNFEFGRFSGDPAYKTGVGPGAQQRFGQPQLPQLRQPVAYTMGQHPQPIPPPDPGWLRRKLMGG